MWVCRNRNNTFTALYLIDRTCLVIFLCIYFNNYVSVCANGWPLTHSFIHKYQIWVDSWHFDRTVNPKIIILSSFTLICVTFSWRHVEERWTPCKTEHWDVSQKHLLEDMSISMMTEWWFLCELSLLTTTRHEH